MDAVSTVPDAAEPSSVTAPLHAAEPPAISVRPRPMPVAESERSGPLDVVRGVALCGILLVNMENFAMVREARYDPLISGGTSALDELIWQITFLFADSKFIAIFTMLFGAGIAMANERRVRQQSRPEGWWNYRSILFLMVAAVVCREAFLTGYTELFFVYWGLWCLWSFCVPRTEAIQYRRMLFLAAVGAAHGLFLWRGDILYFYAFWGLALYFAPRVPSMVLMVAGLALYGWYAVGLDVELWGRHYRSSGFAEQLLTASEGYSLWELHIFRGPWRLQYEYRLESLPLYLMDYPIRFGNHLVGLMFVGMALFKIGWLSGRWRTWSYGIFAPAMLASGAWLVVDSTHFGSRFADRYAAEQFIWGSFLLTFGYMSLAITVTKLVGLRFGLGGFAAVGRMAFTNYLLQSFICTTIFYGYGFGRFERLTRTEQTEIVLAIWVFQIVFSVVWLRLFQMGPLEWIWRSFSYLRFQPILRRRRLPDEFPSVPVSSP